MPAGCGLGKALDNGISRLLLTGKVYLLWGYPYKVASGLAHGHKVG